MKKISVEEFINNKENMELVEYIPYANKVKIVDAILQQTCKYYNGVYDLDSVLLDRIKDQIFIESCTNLDLNIKHYNIDGYDLLVKNNLLDKVIKNCGTEYKELDRLLLLRLSDYIRDKASVKGIINYKLDYIVKYTNEKIPELLNKIEKIDIKSIISNASIVLDKLIQKKNKVGK